MEGDEINLNAKNELFSIEEINHFVNHHHLAFLYISQTNCSVCHALLPKVKKVLAEFPKIQMAFVNADNVPNIAGHLSVFTAPVLILYVDGKEVLREARFVHVEQFKEKMKKIYFLAEQS
ncbi:thioredoxin family protein [Parageobacillus sp. KH3-4]|uniref:thioredoxin family protein n=1 Tax=Parageobacillus sp. KH3-4 TaxID=2916802 RepID=UPI001FCC7AEE|nr:thioredoxin family protein [Parageobacillus sp. KH3-4]